MDKLLQERSLDGVILAGGQSRRMGQDKAHLKVAGKTLLAHQAELMSPWVGNLFVALNGLAIPAAMPPVTPLKDYLGGSEGPLSGLQSALNASSADYLWLMSCDNYAFDMLLLQRLLHVLIETGADVACVSVKGRVQPLLAVMRSDLRNDLRLYLATGARAVMPWYKGLNTQVIDVNEVTRGYNINTQEDYQALIAELG